MMEMLVEGRTRITEKLAITVAKILGKNFTKYNEIKEKTKTVYDARCRYLHDGNTTIIDSSIAQDALDLSRRILVNLFYINCDISEFIERIREVESGTNPFDISM